jgi:hypothetical protein
MAPGATGCPGQPGVEVCWRQGWVVELVEQPELFFERERAVERLGGLLDFAELGELVDGLFGGALEQRPPGALDPLPGRGVRAVMRVSFVAAVLVDGALGEADCVEGVKADVGVGDRVADGLLVAARPVDHDRPDRELAVTEQVEESLQGGGVATWCGPHDRAALVIDDGGEVAVSAVVADLIDSERDQPFEAAVIEVI